MPVGMGFGALDKSEAETEAADLRATKYMMWTLYPLMAGCVMLGISWRYYLRWIHTLYSMRLGPGLLRNLCRVGCKLG